MRVSPHVVAFGVVAHIARLDAAAALAGRLDAVLSVDDGSLGAEANHRLVWRALAGSEAEWVCVLEDDAVPVEDFEAQLVPALTMAPSPIVSLYLGTARPPTVQEQIRRALIRVDRIGACWLVTNQMLHAVGICMRTALVRDMLEVTDHQRLPADERFGRWLRARRHMVAYTVPSLVDHADGSTLIAHRDGQSRTRARKAWSVGGREVWNGSTVTL